MKLVLGEELHILAFLLHFIDEIAADFKGILIQGALFQLAECCLEEVDIFINFLLLAFIKALALIRGLIWNLGRDIAEILGHFDEIAIRFPIFPTDFGEGEGGGIDKGEKKESLDMFWQKPSQRIKQSLLSIFLYFFATFR